MHTAGSWFIPVVTALRGRVYDDVVPTKRQYQCLAIEVVLATIFPVAVCTPPGARISLGVSQRTVWRGIREHSLNASSAYSDMCDGDLDEHVRTIQLSFPNCGQMMMDGHKELLCRGNE